MFGYINIYKDELKFREYALYRHHYCELCKNMGSYSELSRLFLSYDITFFLLLAEPENPQTTNCRKCNMLSCIKKKSEGIYDYFAALSIILIFHKLNNDVIDGELGKILLRSVVTIPYKKASAKFPQIDEPIREGLKLLVAREKEKYCDYIDMSDCFAECIAKSCYNYFAKLSDGEVRLDILKKIVKCVYLIDIIDDVKKDFKHNDYNPLNILADGLANESEILKVAKIIIANLSEASSLLSLLLYSDCVLLVNNIISLGFPIRLKKVLEKNNILNTTL